METNNNVRNEGGKKMIARIDCETLSDKSQAHIVELWDTEHIATLTCVDGESAHLVADTINELCTDVLHIGHYE